MPAGDSGRAQRGCETAKKVLRFLQELSVAETSAVLGKSEGAVTKLQARGLLALRRALQQVGVAASAA